MSWELLTVQALYVESSTNRISFFNDAMLYFFPEVGLCSVLFSNSLTGSSISLSDLKNFLVRAWMKVASSLDCSF